MGLLVSFTGRPIKGGNINRIDNEANQGADNQNQGADNQNQGADNQNQGADNQNQGAGYLVVVGGRRGRYYPGPPAAGG